MQSGVKTSKRNKTLEVLSFITEEYRRTNNAVELQAVLNFCETNDFSTNNLEDLLEDLVNKGTLFQPHGYGTYQPSNA
jgi:DNA replicative helicase MCM subunit Mcm2 (Cdc46/Mcm family)